MIQSEQFDKYTVFNNSSCVVYTCDAEGRITNYNAKAGELWGIKSNSNTNENFCENWKCHYSSEEYVPHFDSLLAPLEFSKLLIHNAQMVIERPGLLPIIIKVNTIPIEDNHGNLIGTINFSFFGDDQNNMVKEPDLKTKELQDRNVETIVERPDGSRFYASVNIDPLFDEDNRITGAVDVFQDITYIKQAELALKESEGRYHNLIQSLDTPLYTTDAEGRVTMFNKAVAVLWGREPAIGKDMWCGSYKILAVNGSDIPLAECPMAVCLQQQRPVHGEEIIVVRPDGSLRNVIPHPQPLFNEFGKMIGAINMLIDITDMKRTENALRESEKKYRELAASLERKVEEKTLDLKKKNKQLESSELRYHKMIEEVEDYAIILLDKDGIVQNWNKGAEKIKGYKEEEIVGKSFSNFYLPADRESGLPFKLLQLARDEGKAIHEGWRMRKDGSTFWGSIVLTALHDDQDRILGFSKVTRDLTERKQAEDRLKEYANQLEFQNKELEQFAYAASHDMKEPLRKIQFYNAAVIQNQANVLDEKSKDFLSRSLNAAKRMNDLIEDLLTYSTTTSNTSNFEEVDLNEVVEEIKLMHKEEIEQDKIQIPSNKLPVIHAIPFQIIQLMSNLINNSVKYKHPDRTVYIEIKANLIKGSLIKEENVEPNKQYHHISVIDNGMGFDPDYSDKIFNIFQRLHSLPFIKGSGIGLAICKRIVQNHHGFITASSREGFGAQFDIYLPQQL
ncbi:MAG: PAS domain S-box protein [Parafilimonas sp.]